MATIKYHDNDGNWVSLYSDAINNRLRKDKNLSDLLDKAAARMNLEITGDSNHTHYHDDRYLPKIEQITANYTQAISDEASARSNEISNEASERDKAIAKEKSERVAADNNLQTSITKEVSDRSTAIKELKTIVDTKAYFDSEGRLVFPNGDLLWIS